MPIINCKRCGQIFNRVGRNICPECVRQEDEAYKVVRSYLREHRDVQLGDLCESTDVPEDWVVEMIRDGRLILHDHPNLAAACERCGAPTQAGRYCSKCARELGESLSAVTQELQQRTRESRQTKAGYHSKDQGTH